MTALINAGQDLLLGASCAACAAPGPVLCRDCAGQLNRNPLRRPTDLDDGAAQAMPIWSGSYYDPIVGKLVIAFKDRGAWTLASTLAWLTARAVAGLVLNNTDCVPVHSPSVQQPYVPPVLVPVPADPSRIRARGIDHTQVIARLAAQQCGISWAPMLRRKAATINQVGLDARSRRIHQRGTMTVRTGAVPWRGLHQKTGSVDPPVIVVDDVVTTGTTIREATRALRTQKISVIGAVTAAQTEFMGRGIHKVLT